jgi:hypothetical protein
MECLLHIGGPKCGSSALQTALSEKPVLKTATGNTVAYAAVRRDGTVATGERLRWLAAQGKHGYVSSTFVRLGETERSAAQAALARLAADSVILSDENWLKNPALIRDSLLPALPGPVRALVYVRPQVEWINAAWWQWGVWQSARFEDWVQSAISRWRWAASIRSFMEGSGIDRIAIRLLPRDIVADFMAIENIAPGSIPTGKAINRGLSAPLLRLLLRNRGELRPGPHASGIDFVLSRHVDLGGRPPWVLDRDTVARIIDECREDNIALCSMLDPASAEAMSNDLRWWSADAYSDRQFEGWELPPMNAEEVNAICVAMVKAIVKLDSQLRMAKAPRDGATGQV